MALRDTMCAALAQYTAQDILARYKQHDMAGTLVLGVGDASEPYMHPQALHNRSTVLVESEQLGTLRLARPAPVMHGTPLQVATAPPLYGEHTEQVLQELGLGAEAIQQLHAARVVRGSPRKKTTMMEKITHEGLWVPSARRADVGVHPKARL